MEETSLEREAPLERQAAFEDLLREHREYQSAFDKKVDRALQTARANWEREQAAALEGARAEALAGARAEAEAEYQSRLRALEEREGKFARRQRQSEAADRLVELGLPSKFAPWLTGDTGEESLERVAAFDAAFRSAVSDAVTARMAGVVPAEPAASPAFDRETLRGMSPREINAHWAEIQHTLKG